MAMGIFAESTKGLFIDSLEIPPFQIGEGEVLAFNWPRMPDAGELFGFISVLEKESAILGLNVNIRLVSALALTDGLMAQKLREVPSIWELINVTCGEVRNRFDTSYIADLSLSELPGTLRRLISVHIACMQSRFVVYDCSGLDPIGEIAVNEFAANRAALGYGFLYMRFPTSLDRAASKRENIVSIQKIYSS